MHRAFVSEPAIQPVSFKFAGGTVRRIFPRTEFSGGQLEHVPRQRITEADRQESPAHHRSTAQLPHRPDGEPLREWSSCRTDTQPRRHTDRLCVPSRDACGRVVSIPRAGQAFPLLPGFTTGSPAHRGAGIGLVGDRVHAENGHKRLRCTRKPHCATAPVDDTRDAREHSPRSRTRLMTSCTEPPVVTTSSQTSTRSSGATVNPGGSARHLLSVRRRWCEPQLPSGFLCYHDAPHGRRNHHVDALSTKVISDNAAQRFAMAGVLQHFRALEILVTVQAGGQEKVASRRAPVSLNMERT